MLTHENGREKFKNLNWIIKFKNLEYDGEILKFEFD